MLKNLLLTIFCLLTINLKSQYPYEKGIVILKSMLNGQDKINFKKTVFMVENTFWDNQLSEQGFESDISLISALAKVQYKNSKSLGYTSKDSARIKQYGSLFKTITDTSIITSKGDSALFLPFRYDFNDMFGEKGWSNMFVTKLLATHEGNCHSMPYLYKIL
jgi:hypothetical protein